MPIFLKPSRLLAVALIIAHGLAVGVIVLAGLPPWLMLLMVLASLVFGLWNASLKRSDAIVALAFLEGGTLNVQSRCGDWFECEVRGSTYVSPLLTVLNLRLLEGAAVKHVVILPDAIDPHDFRALRVWLRWKTGKTATQDSIETPGIIGNDRR